MVILGGVCRAYFFPINRSPVCEPEQTTVDLSNSAEVIACDWDSFTYEFSEKRTPNGRYFEAKIQFTLTDASRLSLLYFYLAKKGKYFTVLYQPKGKNELYYVGDKDYPLFMLLEGEIGTKPDDRSLAQAKITGNIMIPYRIATTSAYTGDFDLDDFNPNDFR